MLRMLMSLAISHTRIGTSLLAAILASIALMRLRSRGEVGDHQKSHDGTNLGLHDLLPTLLENILPYLIR